MIFLAITVFKRFKSNNQTISFNRVKENRKLYKQIKSPKRNESRLLTVTWQGGERPGRCPWPELPTRESWRRSRSHCWHSPPGSRSWGGPRPCTRSQCSLLTTSRVSQQKCWENTRKYFQNGLAGVLAFNFSNTNNKTKVSNIRPAERIYIYI